MPLWLIWAIIGSGLAAAVSYRKAKDLGVNPLASNDKPASAKP